MSDSKLPFEPKGSKFSAAYSGLATHEILAEIDHLPADIRNETRNIVLQGLYQPETDHALETKLTEMEKQAQSDLPHQLSQIVPAGIYERSKYFDTLPMEQVHRIIALEKLAKVEDNTEVYNRHAAGGKKFINELFAAPDMAAAQAQFPEVPLTRRREWYDKSISMVLTDLISPHIERFKRCLSGPHRVDNKLLRTYPCETAANVVNNAYESKKNSLSRIGNCYSQKKAFHRFMLEQPDYVVAARAYKDLQICLAGEQAFSEVKAGLISEHHKATLDDITGAPKKSDHHH